MTDETSTSPEISLEDCYPDRKTISTITGATGEITKIDSFNYGISYKGDYKLLLPCNLPLQFRKEGTMVSFTGDVKEVKPEEMWAGHPFVLTDCKVTTGSSELPDF